MTTGVRIASLRVDAFRGISASIDFDLRAPITLVFAPNGTGKTTLCEAAEWLLTGQVERLRDSKDFDPNVLRSKFVTDGRRPTVVGAISVGIEDRFLSRVAVGSQQEIAIGAIADELRSVGPHDLLSFLAPSAASQEAHHLRAINLRQRWLRGTRFLSAEALAALVDSDSETIERRTQVFADLLGIRHLLDAEKLCDKFISDLASRERYVSERIAGQQSEIERLEAELADTSQRAIAASALSEIAAAETRLDLPIDLTLKETSIANRIEAASVEHGRRQHIVGVRSENIEVAASAWNSRVEAENKIGELSVAEADLTTQLTTIEAQLRAAANALTVSISRQTQQNEQARLLMSARDSLTQHIIALAGTLGLSRYNESPLVTASLKSLQDALPEGRWTRDQQQRRRVELQSAIKAFASDQDEKRRVELIQAQLDILAPDLVSEDAFAILRRDASNLEAVALSVRSRFDSTSAPIARLQSAARDLIAHTHESGVSECPICGHDWGDLSLLRAAISATLDTVPEIARAVQTAADSATQAARLAAARLEQASEKRAQADKLRSELQEVQNAILDRRQQLDRLGISGEEPVSSLRSADWRLSVAMALTALMEERDRFLILIPSMSALLLSDDAPISGLLDLFQATISARDQVIQYELSTTVNDVQDKTSERDRLRSSLALGQQQLRDCREELSSLRPKVARLRALWEAAASGRPWTEEVLAAVRAEISEEKRVLAETEACIAAASAAWSVEVRRARLEELTTAAGPQREKVARMVARIEAAKRAKATFHESYNDVSKRQIEDLSRVVNPLFARMHANRVFDRIKLGKTDEPLLWLADAGSQEMDPGKDFSQGQRQDLALALFLGRARSLGGTFFLDEPVTHLDDLNRVGLLDIFRATVMESSSTLNLVITTASKSLARHLIEKFSSVDPVDTPAGKSVPLRVLELDGNGRTGVAMRTAYPN